MRPTAKGRWSLRCPGLLLLKLLQLVVLALEEVVRAEVVLRVFSGRAVWCILAAILRTRVFDTVATTGALAQCRAATVAALVVCAVERLDAESPGRLARLMAILNSASVVGCAEPRAGFPGHLRARG